MYFYSAVFLALSFLVINVTFAYNTSVNAPEVPYEIFTIETNIEEESEYLGELAGSPHMYEFVVNEDTELSLTLLQKPQAEAVPLSLIIIKENDNKKGVKEMGRLKGKDTAWQTDADKRLGIKLNKSGTFEASLAAGIYRVEVSTPDNDGKYMLVVGDEPYSNGYFSSLSDVREIQKFFGYSIFSMLKSSYIYYPIGIIILSFLIYRTRKYYLSVKK